MAISHAFSNQIADGTNTNIVRPSDWNSAHNQYYTLSGNTLGASTVSGTNVVFQGSGNVSLSGTGSTIIVYGTGGGGGGVAIGASSQTATSGTVNFVNSNGITFGMSGSNQITASYTTSPVSNVTAGNNISLSTAGSTLTINAQAVAAAAGGQTATSGTINFANSNGITFGMSGSNQITASYTVPTVPTSYVSNVNGSSGQISLNVGSSLSSSTAGSSITFGLASNITTALQSAGNYLTTARASNDAVGLNTAGTNVTWTVNSSGISLNAGGYAGTNTSANNASVTLNSNGLTISVAAPGGGGIAAAAGTQTATSGTINFANSNGITFGMSGSNQITASYTVPTVPTSYVSNVNGSSGQISLNVGSSLSSSTAGSSITFGLASNISTYLQTTGNYLTTARSSNDAVGLNTAGTNVTWTVNSSGISLNAGGYAGTNTSANNASITLNSNGLTISVAPPGGGGVMYANLSGNTSGNTTASGSTLNFSGINLTLSGTNNSQIAISAPATSSLVAGANITISTAGSTISIIGGAGGGGAAFSAGTQSVSTGTVNFANSNGITFGMSGSNQITASHNGITTQTVQTQASGAIAGTGFTTATTAGTVITGALGTNGLNLGVPAYLTTQSVQTQAAGNIAGTGFSSTTTAGTAITAALGTNGLTMAIPAYLTAAAGAGNAIGVTGGGSTGVAAAGTVYFGTANQLTFGFDPVSTRVTAAWGLIVTAGTTNANPVRQLSFSDVNGISFGLSTGAGAGHTITASVATSLTNVNISAGTTSNNLSNFVFSNSNGVSFGLNGSTVTASVAAAGGVIQSGYSPHGDYPLVTGLIGQGTLALDPDIFPDLTLNMVAMPINFSFATNSTGSFTISNWLGLYSRNVSSISLAHSTSFTAAITFSGIANSASYNGWRNITYNWSTSVSGGRYWIANIMRTTTGGANCSFSQYLASQINTNFSGAFGVASNATAQLTLGQGFYSASTTALPGSIAFTEIRGSNSLAQRFPMVAFGYNTV